MDGGNRRMASFTAVSIVVLFATLVLGPLSVISAENSTSDETVTDGRVTGFLALPSEQYHRTWTIDQGEWLSLTIDCTECEAQITLGDSTITTTNEISIQADENGLVELVISSTIEEFVSYSLIESIDEKFSKLRPAPTETTDNKEVHSCGNLLGCIDATRENLNGITFGEYSESHFIRGALEQAIPEYIPLNVSEGDSIELQFMHTTGDVSLSVYYQNETSEHLFDKTIEQSIPLTANEPGMAEIWYFPENGRAVLKVESGAVETTYALKALRYQRNDSSVFIQEHDDLKIVGHHSTTVTIEMNDTQKFTLMPFHSSAEVRIDQLVSGEWITGNAKVMHSNLDTVFYPYPNISAARFIVEAEIHWIEIHVLDISDIQSGEEAPSYRPPSPDSDNSSWPLMPTQSNQISGELTLSIHDTADVYRLEIEGWDESEHLVKVIVEGGNLEVLQLELWSIDQETWSDEDSRTVTLANGKIQTVLEMSRGTHFFRISLLDSENSTLQPWGEDVPSIPYVISTVYTLIDEGNEPYFPPDENAEKWGARARFFLGSLFLLPVLFLASQLYRSKKSAEHLLMKSEQLAWFKKQMDSGEITPQQSRKNLAKALQAITMLNWDDANKAWGDTDLEYRTENVAIAVWKLDSRMAKDSDAIPVMVGVHILQGNWDLAALRFDAPVGQAWEIVQVEPRFLHRGEEVFLDTMAVGNKTFIMAELVGGATSVDIELNGRMDGEPSAARIPTTLTFNTHEEE